MVMINCPRTGTAIPTGIKTDRDSFRSSAVFFARTFLPELSHCARMVRRGCLASGAEARNERIATLGPPVLGRGMMMARPKLSCPDERSHCSLGPRRVYRRFVKPRANDRRDRANQSPTILEGDERCGLEQIFQHQQVGRPVSSAACDHRQGIVYSQMRNVCLSG